MIWLFLLLAVVAFALALAASSITLAVVCLLVALGFIIAFVMGLLASRIGSQSVDQSQLIDPQELRRLREQAVVRRDIEAPGMTPAEAGNTPAPDATAS